MVSWAYFPRSDLPEHLRAVVEVFESVAPDLRSRYGAWQKWVEAGAIGDPPRLSSNQVLEMARPGFERMGFSVEGPKKKLLIPVPETERASAPQKYNPDAILETAPGRITVIEVEAGGASANNHWRKDLMKAALAPGVDHLVIALREEYKHWSRKNRMAQVNYDFRRVRKELDLIYASERLRLPFSGLLLIGY